MAKEALRIIGSPEISAEVLKQLSLLADHIKAIEGSSKKATQATFMVGDALYLLGALDRREGTYHLVMYKGYQFFGKETENPFRSLSGEFDSFGELEKAVNSTQGPRYVKLDGDRVRGFIPSINSPNTQGSDGKLFIPCGEIAYPRLYLQAPTLERIE
jgi:hypothetical protein